MVGGMLKPTMPRDAFVLALAMVVIGTIGDVTGYKGVALIASAALFVGYLIWFRNEAHG
jgi:hypothetical protein